MIVVIEDLESVSIYDTKLWTIKIHNERLLFFDVRVVVKDKSPVTDLFRYYNESFALGDKRSRFMEAMRIAGPNGQIYWNHATQELIGISGWKE